MLLQKSIAAIQSLCDINSGCSLLCSLKWSEIEQMLSTTNINICNGEINKNKNISVSNSPIRHILQVSAIFKSCSSDIKDSVVLFRYAVDMRDPCNYPDSYFKFGNPEYLLGDLSVIFNGGSNVFSTTEFKSDKYDYAIDIEKNETFDVLVKPALLADTFFANTEQSEFRRENIQIKFQWFNNSNFTENHMKDCTYKVYDAEVVFKELTESYDTEKALENVQGKTAIYNDIDVSPLLRVIVENKNDDYGENTVVYDILIHVRDVVVST